MLVVIAPSTAQFPACITQPEAYLYIQNIA